MYSGIRINTKNRRPDIGNRYAVAGILAPGNVGNNHVIVTGSTNVIG